jgi:hypothetical protein
MKIPQPLVKQKQKCQLTKRHRCCLRRKNEKFTSETSTEREDLMGASSHIKGKLELCVTHITVEFSTLLSVTLRRGNSVEEREHNNEELHSTHQPGYIFFVFLARKKKTQLLRYNFVAFSRRVRSDQDAGTNQVNQTFPCKNIGGHCAGWGQNIFPVCAPEGTFFIGKRVSCAAHASPT